MRTIVREILINVMQAESKLVLWKYKPRIVAITGSVGKTSTKDAVYAVLSKVAYVRKSEKSYNSELGLPLTILGVPNGWNNLSVWMQNICKGAWLFLWPHKYPKWLILEVGVGKPGDMARTASWLKTDAVIITAIGDTPAHIEFFESRKHLVEEKSGLIKTLKQDGVLILNKDDETVDKMGEGAKHRIIKYGFSGDVDVQGGGESIAYSEAGEPEGIIFRVDVDGSSLPVVIDGVFGKNHTYASLAALAFAYGFKLNMLEGINALKSYDVPPGRMRLLRGFNDTLIIDDTYNSSPFACESALRTLGEIKCSGRKIAILGDMLELGKHTVEAHKKIGKIATEVADVLLVVGPRSQDTKEGAMPRAESTHFARLTSDKIFHFTDSYKAGEFIKTFIEKGDVVLVKGSQGMRMERVVGEILLDQKNKENLLVRQDKEWLAKK